MVGGVICQFLFLGSVTKYACTHGSESYIELILHLNVLISKGAHCFWVFMTVLPIAICDTGIMLSN